MTGWTRSIDGGEIIRVQAEPSSLSLFPVQPGIQHHANPPTCTVKSCPCLSLCHAPLPCHARLPLCHACFPCVIPAKAGIQNLFPIRHVLVTVSAGGRASLSLPLDSR